LPGQRELADERFGERDARRGAAMIRATRIRLLAVLIALSFASGVVALAFPREKAAPPIRVTAVFEKAIGLFEQSHVRVLGVSVGRVESVTPTGTTVEVVMKIDGDRKIPADARAVLVPISLIADRYLQLAPVYRSGPVLTDGDVIGVERTAIPAELDDVLDQLKKLLDAVEAGTAENPESIGEAVQNLAAALKGSGEDFSRVLDGGGTLAGSVVENAAAVDASVAHLASLASALAERRGDIATLNSRLYKALSAIASERRALDGALANAAVLTEQLGSLVKEHRPALEADLSVLADTTQILMRHQDSVIQSLEWLHVLADGADNAHNEGAIHREPGKPAHIDVRDEHLFACPDPVPAAVCLLLGLTGGSLPISLPPELGGPAAARAAPGAAEAPAGPDPLNLLDLLPRLLLGGLGGDGSEPASAPTPGGTGGLLSGALGWLL
jgi:phospholipid/cholesterol/gamma-HCH transport system substrate-binding protein